MRLKHDIDVKEYPYDCYTCLDTRRVFDEDLQRKIPCPDCVRGNFS